MRQDAVILVPSYEPDELLTKTVKNLHDEGFNVLVVNDGSGNEYNKIFESVKPYCTYLEHMKNKGKGAALKYGFRNVLEFFPKAKYVITADGDGQHSTKDIIKAYDKLVETNELVFGVRHFDREVPFKSRFGNEFSKISRSLLTKQFISDDQCGLRGFPIRFIPELVKIQGNRYEYEMNQIVLFQLKQYRIHTIPVQTIYLDNNSKSHFSPFKDTFRIQSIIFSHSIIALIVNALLIAGLIVSFYFIEFKYQAFMIPACYLSSVTLYLLLLSIFYPTKVPLRRFTRELLFASIRLLFAGALIGLFYFLLKVPYQVVIPISVLFATSLNVLLAWAFRKIYPNNR